MGGALIIKLGTNDEITVMKLGTVIPYQKKVQKIYESHVKPIEFC